MPDAPKPPSDADDDGSAPPGGKSRKSSGTGRSRKKSPGR